MKSKFTAMIAAGVMGVAIGSASAADLRPAYKAPVAAPPPFSWTGFYIGGHGGYGWGEANATPTGIAGLIVDPFRSNTNGWFGGGTIGYNYQYGPLVLGTEGEFSWSGIDGSANSNFLLGLVPGAAVSATYSNNWIGTLSTRVGVAYETVLIYGKAGVAWANNDYSVNATVPGPGGLSYASSISETETGWLVGGGVEWAFARNWSAKIEGNYMDFGSRNRAFAGVPVGGGVTLPVNADIDSHISTVKFGVNYRFY